MPPPCPYRDLDKREYLVIIRDTFVNLHKTYVVTPNLNRLDETVQTRGQKHYGFDEK